MHYYFTQEQGWDIRLHEGSMQVVERISGADCPQTNVPVFYRITVLYPNLGLITVLLATFLLSYGNTGHLKVITDIRQQGEISVVGCGKKKEVRYPHMW